MKLEGHLPRLQILSNADIQKIYFAALEVLERTGVAVKNEEACDFLNEAGAYVDGETARIPSSLIEKTVNLAPKQIIMLVMSDELLGMVKRFKRGIEVNEEIMAVDLIDKVGIGGHYIQETHTLDYFRSETWQPRLLDRSVIDEWVEQGSKDLAEQTKARVKEILDRPAEKKLSDEQARELSEIIKNRGG